MAKRVLPDFYILWNKHKQLYSQVFSEALLALSRRKSIPNNEDAVSEILNIHLTQVCFDRCRNDREEVKTPDWEKPISPKTDRELKGGIKRKRPDFTCKCINSRAEIPEEYEIALHVECKMLGLPTSEKWILNRNYVKNGINRFDSHSYEYGKHAPSGMMIGYIRSMTPEEIQTEVNEYQKNLLPNYPAFTFIFDKEKTFKTCQSFQRLHVIPLQFELIHLWVDLRDKY